ncbi:FkbM family methyltransferase [soil metagenome]
MHPNPNKYEPFGTYALTGVNKALLDLAQGLGEGWLAHRMGLVLRKMVLQNRRQVIDGESLGLKARFYPLSDLGDRHLLFLPGSFNRDEFRLMAQTLRPDDVFVDIGANVGMFSLWAAKKIKAKNHIFSLEPNPVTFERLLFNMRLNDQAGVIVPLQVGVADRESYFDLHVDPRNAGGSSIMDTHVPHNFPSAKIFCRPLLSILQEQGVTKIDLLKIDIEGAEEMALNPFFQNAPRSLFPKRVFIESESAIDFPGLGYTFLRRTTSHNSVYELRK